MSNTWITPLKVWFVLQGPPPPRPQEKAGMTPLEKRIFKKHAEIVLSYPP